MKRKLKTVLVLLLAAILFAGGIAVGWRWRDRRPVVAPVTAEITLDAKNRPATLKQFVTMPNGQRLQHGQQFKWEWHDEPSGCIVLGLQIEREDYDGGSMSGFAAWSDPSPTLTPTKRIDAAVLTKYPDER